jgi:hypothetical protein
MVHIPRIRVTRPRHMTVLLVASPVLVVAGVVGFLAGGAGADVPVAFAACGLPISCALRDTTVTSALSVYHVKSEGMNVREVEPNSTDTWAIHATWSSDLLFSSCPCTDLVTADVAATVTWTDGTGWSVSCTGCDAVYGPIYGISVCGVDGCGATPDNGWAYKLIVDTKHTFFAVSCPEGPATIAYLSSVDYATTAVSNGNLVYTATCTEGAAVSPTSQLWSQTDPVGFDCAYNCNASGPSIVITYQ